MGQAGMELRRKADSSFLSLTAIASQPMAVKGGREVAMRSSWWMDE
jgi:hypothetical protein